MLALGLCRATTRIDQTSRLQSPLSPMLWYRLEGGLHVLRVWCQQGGQLLAPPSVRNGTAASWSDPMIWRSGQDGLKTVGWKEPSRRARRLKPSSQEPCHNAMFWRVFVLSLSSCAAFAAPATWDLCSRTRAVPFWRAKILGGSGVVTSGLLPWMVPISLTCPPDPPGKPGRLFGTTPRPPGGSTKPAPWNAIQLWRMGIPCKQPLALSGW